jgi:zinc/manganese transport system ATP-binding protein
LPTLYILIKRYSITLRRHSLAHFERSYSVVVTEACLTVANLTLGYNRHPSVHHINGVLRQRNRLAVVDGSRPIKSTPMKGIVGLLRPTGRMWSKAPRTRFADLPQLFELDGSFPALAHDFVSLGLWPGCRVAAL